MRQSLASSRQAIEKTIFSWTWKRKEKEWNTYPELRLKPWREHTTKATKIAGTYTTNCTMATIELEPRPITILMGLSFPSRTADRRKKEINDWSLGHLVGFSAAFIPLPSPLEYWASVRIRMMIWTIPKEATWTKRLPMGHLLYDWVRQ